MLTLRGIFQDAQISFTDEVPFTGKHQVLITFLDTEDEIVVLSKDKYNSLTHENFGLTARELGILSLTQKGMKNREIAQALGLVEGTVRNYLSSIYRKLEVQNRTHAIHKAVELGLLLSSGESQTDK